MIIGLPKAGWWGICALNLDNGLKYQGKELSLDAVLWVKATDMMKYTAMTPQPDTDGATGGRRYEALLLVIGHRLVVAVRWRCMCGSCGA